MTAIEKSVRLGDHCLKVGSGATPRGGDKVYLAAGMSFIRSQNVYNEGFNTDGLVHISPMHAKQLDGVTVEPGDILLNITGDSVARCCLVPKEVLPARVNQHVAIVRPDPEFIDARFLRYWMVSAPAQAKLHKLAGAGATRNALTKGMIQDLEVPCPDIDEQREIADILSSFDDKIELNRRMNRTLEAMGRAVFKSWFVDFDPVLDNALRAGNPIPEEFTDRAAQRAALLNGNVPASPGALLASEHAALFPSRFQDSPLGPIPEGWRYAPLDSIAVFRNGLALQNFPAEGSDSLPVIKITQLRKGNTQGAERASSGIAAECVVHDGDVLFSWSGTLEVVLWAGGKGALNQHLFKVTSNHYPKWFYYYWTKHYLEHFRGIAQDKATTMGHIKRHHLSDVGVCIPEPGLLELMDGIMCPITAENVRLLTEAAHLAVTRDVLLPQLLSGELSVEASR